MRWILKMAARATATALAIVTTAATTSITAQEQDVELQGYELTDDAWQEGEQQQQQRAERERGLAGYREHLTQTVDSMRFTTVSINEEPSARQALKPFEMQKLDGTMSGYRVGVYFNNSAQARNGAMDVMQRCDSLLGDIPATMSYANPYFKVSVGYCTSEEEAVIMLHRVQQHFPKAYLMREIITVDNIIAARELELNKQTSENILPLP